MSRKSIVYLTGMAIWGLSLFVFAAPIDNPVGISKATWLEQVKSSAPAPICHSFVEDETISAQMKLKNISYEKCVSLIPVIADKCEKKYDATIPMTINEDNAEKWGRVLGDCIGNDFAMGYLYAETPILH